MCFSEFTHFMPEAGPFMPPLQPWSMTRTVMMLRLLLDPLARHLVYPLLGPKPRGFGASEKVAVEKSHVHVVDGSELKPNGFAAGLDVDADGPTEPDRTIVAR